MDPPVVRHCPLTFRVRLRRAEYGVGLWLRHGGDTFQKTLASLNFWRALYSQIKDDIDLVKGTVRGYPYRMGVRGRFDLPFLVVESRQQGSPNFDQCTECTLTPWAWMPRGSWN